jgi:uncharacterized protein (DUF2147 family)
LDDIVEKRIRKRRLKVRFERVVWTLLLASVLLSSPTTVLGGDAEGIVGVWNTSENDARIEIYRCGAEYCGKISYLQDPNYPADDKEGMAGLPLMDRYNPDPALRKRPLVGLSFMEGFRYLGHNTWDGGRIYNPENGKKYKATISLADSNRLMLRGYWGISLLGRTETWVRSSNKHNTGA